MSLKKYLKNFLRLLCLIIVMTGINLAIEVGTNGMWLFDIPKSDNVTSVTISNPSITEEHLEIVNREQIETCVNLSGFLKYRPFANTEITTGKEELPITFVYHTNDGGDIKISANSVFVFYNGKKHILKEENTFVKIVGGLFYQQYFDK